MEDPDVDSVELRVSEAEEVAASRKLAAIEAGRRKGGIAGAAMAGAMLTLQEIYEGPPPDDTAVVSESPDDPTDIDTDGIEVTVGDVNVWAPPPAPPADG